MNNDQPPSANREPGKLVRDRIPEIIRESGEQPTTWVLDHAEYRSALFTKLAEETGELFVATELADQVEELADVYEVLLALAFDLGTNWSAVERVAERKRAERGGFKERVWLAATPPTR